MIKFILGTFLIAVSCSTAMAHTNPIKSIEKINMNPYKTRILSNQEMIFIDSDKSLSERVDKLNQPSMVFDSWKSLIREKTRS